MQINHAGKPLTVSLYLSLLGFYTRGLYLYTFRYYNNKMAEELINTGKVTDCRMHELLLEATRYVLLFGCVAIADTLKLGDFMRLKACRCIVSVLVGTPFLSGFPLIALFNSEMFFSSSNGFHARIVLRSICLYISSGIDTCRDTWSLHDIYTYPY